MKFNQNIRDWQDTKFIQWLRKVRYSPFGIGFQRAFDKKWVRYSVAGLGVIFMFFVGLYISIYMGAFGKVPSKDELSSIKQEAATVVLDRDGELIGKYYILDRQPLGFKEIPQHLINALVATEDVRFYRHDGIDNVSLGRVFFKSLLFQDESAGGGSTITLQLAKNLFGRKEYGKFGIVINKFREAIIARRIEAIYDKNEILTMYLNTVPFSDNTYGIESASRKFYNKPATNLTLDEAATLVGTLKANNYYNPRLHPDRCEARKKVVLEQMEKYNLMPEDTLAIVLNDTTKLEYRSFDHNLGIAPYFREEVKRQLAQILDTIAKNSGKQYDLYKDGLIVHTTLNFDMQRMAEESMKEHMAELQASFEKAYGKYAPWINNKKIITAAAQNLPEYKRYKKAGLEDEKIIDTLKSSKHEITLFRWEGDTIQNISVIDSLQHYMKFLNSGSMSIDPNSGEVLTYVGGIDYRYYKFDHISQSKRQVGSTFKPIVYTAAIDNGMRPCTYYPVQPVSYSNYNGWTPTNAGGLGNNDPYLNYSLEKALSNSVNTVAVKVLNDVGITNVIKMGKKLGIKGDLPRQPSIALGTAELSILDVIGAYASFVNQAKPVKPYLISKIQDRDGNDIFNIKSQSKQKPAYSDYTNQVLLEMMKGTINNGTATRIRWEYKLKNDIAGKTGTTQDNRDGWFVGITPKLVSVTWVGNDNHSIGFNSTHLGQGANSALPIFAKFYQKLNADSTYTKITESKFKVTSYQAIEDMQCEPEKHDGFLERLFKTRDSVEIFTGI